MRTLRRLLLAASAISALFASPAAGQARRSDAFLPGSRIWVTGASNIRRFTCRSTDFDAQLALPMPEAFDLVTRTGAAPRSVAAHLQLTIPVGQLNCGRGGINGHLRETLDADHHPAIEFTMVRAELGPAGAAISEEGIGASDARLDGWLTINGVTRPASVHATVSRDASGALLVRGAQEIRVTDFGVRPPRRFAGLLRVRDRVVVHFTLALAPHALIAVR